MLKNYYLKSEDKLFVGYFCGYKELFLILELLEE